MEYYHKTHQPGSLECDIETALISLNNLAVNLSMRNGGADQWPLEMAIDCLQNHLIEINKEHPNHQICEYEWNPDFDAAAHGVNDSY